MLDISLAYTWSVCWLYMAAWGLVWEVVTNTQHDTVCSLCQQLKRLRTSEIFGYELLRAPVLFTHVASHAEYEPVRSSRILDQRCQNKSDLPCCPDESNIIRPQKLSHLHLWGSRPWTSLELEWEMSECLYFLYQWSLMLYETLWCFDKVPRQPSKTMSTKKSCWPQLLHGMAQCVLRMTFSACTIPRSLWLQMVASWVGSNMRKPWNCAHHQNRMSWQSETCNSGLLRACRLPHSILVSVSKTSLKNLSIIP